MPIGVSKPFELRGKEVEALQPLDLNIAAREFVAFSAA
jgi:hypothetical protein